MRHSFMIGDLAAATGTKVGTIRFYEEIGLMQPAPRTASGRRTYTDAALHRLRLIRQARTFGFDTAEIRSLLALSDRPQSDCGAATQIAHAHLLVVEQRIAQLMDLKQELTRIAESCDGGTAAECRVLGALNSA